MRLQSCPRQISWTLENCILRPERTCTQTMRTRSQSVQKRRAICCGKTNVRSKYLSLNHYLRSDTRIPHHGGKISLTRNVLSFVQHEDDHLFILLDGKAATNPNRATAHLGSEQSGGIKTTFQPVRCSSQLCTEVAIVSLRQSRDTRLERRRNARIQPPGEADLNN